MQYIHRLQQKTLQGGIWSAQVVQQMRFSLRFLQAGLFHTRLFLIGEMLQSLAFSCGSSLDFLQSVHRSPVLVSPTMDTELQAWPHHAEERASITWHVCKQHKALRNSVWFVCLFIYFQPHKISCLASSSQLEDSRSHLDQKSYLAIWITAW